MTDYSTSSQSVPAYTSEPGLLRQKLPHAIVLFLAVAAWPIQALSDSLPMATGVSCCHDS